jgi:hypothetical protein
MSTKEHKFFERFLDNDLQNLSTYLLDLKEIILNKGVSTIPESEIDNVLGKGLETTRLGRFYNIFTFPKEEISVLYNALLDMTKEACDYYGINFEEEDYYINGWFNVEDYGICDYNKDGLHDHMGGTGAPFFHGYYCINAEPSVTYYNIDREKYFENVNINNRAIVSETGHPHTRGSWQSMEKRITLAYDIVPMPKTGSARDDFSNFIKFK